MRDQYGRLVPRVARLNLGVDTLAYDEVQEIVSARWYTDGEDRAGGGYIWVALDDLSLTRGYFDEEDTKPAHLERIAEPLKRYSVEDDFYHA